MKKTVSLLIVVLIIMSIFTTIAAANGENADYNYVVEGTEYSVEFSGSNVSAEKQVLIAQKLVGLYDDGAQPYGLGCILFGHDLLSTTTTVTRHKVSAYEPRCLREIYDVEYCEDCDYTKETLIGSQYINCCPED